MPIRESKGSQGSAYELEEVVSDDDVSDDEIAEQQQPPTPGSATLKKSTGDPSGDDEGYDDDGEGDDESVTVEGADSDIDEAQLEEEMRTSKLRFETVDDSSSNARRGYFGGGSDDDDGPSAKELEEQELENRQIERAARRQQLKDEKKKKKKARFNFVNPKYLMHKIKDKKGGKKKGDKKGSQQPDEGEARDEEDAIKKMTTEQAFEKFKTSEEGLTTGDANQRAQEYGPNALEETKKNPLIQFLGLMWNPLSWAMEVAAILSLIVADWPDFGLILALLLINSTIAYWEESQAGNAIAALKAQLTPKATCKRDGTWQVIDASTLVPGDLIRIKLGDVAPADLKVIAGENIKADQAALTGESLPVGKEVGDEIFSGSVIKMGEAECLVHSTGMHTFFGRTASLVANTVREGHFQKVLKSIGWFCIIFILIWVVAELLVEFVARKAPCRITGYNDECPGLSNVIVLIVGGIPVAMPTVLSVTMAIGAAQLAKKEAIVRRLTAVEELAGMDILCSDKTGTLTLNKLTVDVPYAVGGATKEQVMFDAGLASKHGDAIDDAIDIAIINAIKEAGQEDRLYEHKITRFKPFDPVGKRTEAFVTSPDGKQFRATKGAPQIILELSKNQAEIEEEVHRMIDDFAKRGYRCIGVGRAEDPNGEHWIMSGLIPLFDPPRHDTAQTIATSLKMGVRVKMITGDQLAIAKETARTLGMGSEKIHTAQEFAVAEKEEDKRLRGAGGIKTHRGGNVSDRNSPFIQLIEDADGFAQVFPETKFEIVKRLQEAKHFVGMTGDGVNDAPALKRADVGIAVAGATDAARAAADIVLMSPGLSVIIDALIGSRKIFQRMKNYATYSISVTVRIVLTFGLLTIVWNFYFPTIIVVIIAILNDGTILTISKDRVNPSPIPDQWKLNEIFFLAFVLGTYLMGATLFLFNIVRHTDIFQDWFDLRYLTDPEIRGLLYIYISVSGQATIFVTRSRSFFWKGEPPATALLGAFILAQVIATFIGVYGLRGYPNNGVQSFQGCGWAYALLAWIWVLIFFIPMDWIKIAIIKYIFKADRLHVSLPAKFKKGPNKAFRQTAKEGKNLKKEGKGKEPNQIGNTLEDPHPSPSLSHPVAINV